MDHLLLARDLASHPDWLAKTDAELLSLYRTPAFQYQVSWVKNASLQGAFGLARAAEIFATLDALTTNSALPAAVQWQFRIVVDALNGLGINVGDPETRAHIGEFVTAGVITAAERDTILGWGVESVTYPDVQLLGEPATEAAIAIARQLIPRLAEAAALKAQADQAQAIADNAIIDAEARWRAGDPTAPLMSVEAWKASF